MGKTLVEYEKDKGFWISESMMQLVLHYIVEEIEKNEHPISDKSDLLMMLRWDIDDYTRGHMSVRLFDEIDSLADEQIIIRLLNSVKETLQNKGSLISVEELMNIPTRDLALKYILDKKPFPAAELICVIDPLIQMLERTWEHKDYQMELNWTYFD
ncbi:hypothetical protein [Chryseobacterium jejuense]|uniref:hypothetical protein n=1 Tax=Chryseobacterium jejuense TaxID=445960 RepID=UPI001AE1911B|nr:hypothetical protein [Chryseobacterium jejuense]MBP2616425.1 hypothetical protein [Chryseobacterium jejuense]